ncbi:unnamed protein product [Caenorhabditis sp. 36 PRJEB53466]|nr:unnamed protein product [Caenorhabditis sp. 36 PRJEB53466]
MDPDPFENVRVTVPDGYKYLRPINEVMVTMVGKPITPSLVYFVQGLNPNDEYVMKLRLKCLDDCVTSCKKDACAFNWPSLANREHASRPGTGQFWMENHIDMSEVTVTRSRNRANRGLFTVPNHTYVPILTLVHCRSEKTLKIKNEELKFKAVIKKYQNEWIRAVKSRIGTMREKTDRWRLRVSERVRNQCQNQT